MPILEEMAAQAQRILQGRQKKIQERQKSDQASLELFLTGYLKKGAIKFACTLKPGFGGR